MKNRKQYSKEFKLNAIKLSNESDCIKDVAISLGVRAAMLYKWRKEYYQQGAEVFPGVGKSTGIFNAEKEELNRLRKENRELKMERDILKKAVSIFSKND